MPKITIAHNKPFIDPQNIKAVESTLRSGWIAQGPKVEEFERSLCRFLKAPQGEAAATSSGTSAIYLALYALGVGKKDEVIIPTFVCSALLNAVFMIGAKPVLADVNEDDFNICYKQVKKKITKRTKAIIVPHIFGMPAKVDKFMKFGIPVIEDCAQAIGAQYKGKMAGTLGTISIFSFYATKMLTSGQGGMVFSRNRSLIKKIKDYREFDCRKTYKKRFNFQMMDLQASLGVSQLKLLPGFIRKRNAIARRYLKIVKGNKKIGVQSGDGQSVHYRFVIAAKTNRPLIAHFAKHGIRTIIPIERYELLHRYLKEDPKKYPVAEQLALSLVSLPVYPALKEGEIRKVENALKEIRG